MSCPLSPKFVDVFVGQAAWAPGRSSLWAEAVEVGAGGLPLKWSRFVRAAPGRAWVLLERVDRGPGEWVGVRTSRWVTEK